MASALRPLRALSRAALEPRARRLQLSAARGDAVVISGRKLARQIRQEARHEVEQWVAAGNRRPHLSVVLVGENPASRSYGLNKTKAAADVGISSETILRPASISEEELLELLGKLNSDAAVDGLLVQLPLPGEQLSSPLLHSQNAAKACRMGSTEGGSCPDRPPQHQLPAGFRLCGPWNPFLAGSLSWGRPWGCLEILWLWAGLGLQSVCSALHWELAACNWECWGASGAEL
ncbi:bifunctional methylenetetrahydrofolate dehydrogenase/cyclohydrolase, mitochondrial-like isoform 1-T1 [Acridotheres tristis]